MPLATLLPGDEEGLDTEGSTICSKPTVPGRDTESIHGLISSGEGNARLSRSYQGLAGGQERDPDGALK